MKQNETPETESCCDERNTARSSKLKDGDPEIIDELLVTISELR